jgi:outer membrane murein-binding lipoprotein Lpp
MDSNYGVLIINLIVSAVVGTGTALFTIGQYKNKLDRMEKDVEKLAERKEALRTDVDKLIEFKTQAQKFIDRSIYKDQSPLSLTEFGEELVNDSGLKDVFDDIKDDLAGMLEEMEPTSQYDVQEKARALMDSLAGYEPFRRVEKYAFDHGKDLNQILRAGAILLRDYYFEKHPELVNSKEDW